MGQNALSLRLSCLCWGHHVDNGRLAAAGEPPTCRCGAPYLSRDGSTTRVRHTLSCFLRHHSYVRLGDRDGCHEYLCVRCGHPLVIPAGKDPYATRSAFPKKVRYLCGILGHRVEKVAERHGFAEYACHCGHSFLKPQESRLARITHPLVCVAFGHFVQYVTDRGGYAEYVCCNCGHPFCFAEPRPLSRWAGRS